MPIRPFAIEDTAAVIELWHLCGLTRPWNDPARDIQRKMDQQPQLFFVIDADGRPVASLMAGYEGHRGWINYLAVHPAHRGKGHARTLMAHAEAALLAIGCPKVNLQIRADNSAVPAFYRSLGYGVDEVISMGKRLIQDDVDKPRQ